MPNVQSIKQYGLVRTVMVMIRIKGIRRERDEVSISLELRGTRVPCIQRNNERSELYGGVAGGY